MEGLELLANQLQLVHRRVSALGNLSPREWLARPLPTENRVGFTAWHIVATRDWTVRAVLQGARPLGWDAPFLGTGVSFCDIPFGMPAGEADAIAERVNPAEVVAYSEAVTEELLRWLRSAKPGVLAAPPSDGRAHLALSPRYNERGYRHEFEEDPDDMSQWPVWALLTRPSFAHCIGHLAEIELARKVS